jgi:FkbM family methyltransferase
MGMEVQARGVLSAAVTDRSDVDAALTRAEAAGHLPFARPLHHLRPFLHRVAGPATVTCEIFTGQAMRVVLPEIVGTELWRRGYIEASLTRVLAETLRPGMTFVDVGAHYGYHSLVASLIVGPTGAVFALEPSRSVLPLLTANTGGAGNVTVDGVAASDRNGTAELRDFGRRHSALSTLFPTARVPPRERRRLQPQVYSVPCTTLDDHLAAAGAHGDFVKIDAEGSELDILRGMRRVLREDAPVVALETGDYDGMPSPDTASCIEFLEDLGYECFEYTGGLRPHRRRRRYGYDNLYFIRGGRSR